MTRRQERLVWMLHNCGDGFISDRILATMTKRGRSGILDKNTWLSVRKMISETQPYAKIGRWGFGEQKWPEGGIYLIK